MANKRKNALKSVFGLDAQPEKESILPVDEQEIKEKNEQVHLNEISATISPEDVNSLNELHNIDVKTEIKKIVSEETQTPEEDVNVIIDEVVEEETQTPEEDVIIDETLGEEIAPEKDEDDTEIDEVVEEEQAPHTLKSLSRAEFRQFQRTGKIPK